MSRFLNFFLILLACAGFAAAAPVPHGARRHTSQPPAVQGSQLIGRATVDVQPRIFVEDVAVIRRTPEVPTASVPFTRFVEDKAVIPRSPQADELVERNLNSGIVRRMNGEGPNRPEREPKPIKLGKEPGSTGAQLGEFVMGVVDLIQSKVDYDKDDRGRFTTTFIDEALKKRPDANWMIVCTDHEATWKGEKGKDWDQTYAEHEWFGKTGYTVYWGHEGEFTLKGDGGFLNWAYAGKFTKDPNNEHHIFFQA